MVRNRAITVAPAARPRNRSDQSGGQDGGHSGDQNPSTYLVIPYFTGDEGRPGVERPLPPTVAGWLCPAIIVNGQPGQNTFRRGEQTRVTVDVGNYGAGTLTAPVNVRVWWSDPTTGFTTLNVFGQASVAVPNSTVKRTPEIVSVIPTTAPEHVCLLANVWSPMDTSSPPTPDPVNDRHWAQLNINEITVAPGQPFHFLFWAGNPLAHDAKVQLSATLLAREAEPALERLRRMEWTRIEGVELQLRGALQLRDEGQQREPSQFALRAGERRPMVLAGVVPPDASTGSSVVIEVKSTVRGEQGISTGSFGLIVHVRG